MFPKITSLSPCKSHLGALLAFTHPVHDYDIHFISILFLGHVSLLHHTFIVPIYISPNIFMNDCLLALNMRSFSLLCIIMQIPWINVHFNLKWTFWTSFFTIVHAQLIMYDLSSFMNDCMHLHHERFILLHSQPYINLRIILLFKLCEWSYIILYMHFSQPC